MGCYGLVLSVPVPPYVIRRWTRTCMLFEVIVFSVVFLFLQFCFYIPKHPVGARGHTTRRILRRLETEKYGTYTPCESKLPPPGACVTLVLNQCRLHTTRKKKIKKGIETPLQARRRSTPAYNAGGFRVGFSPTRHPPSTASSLEK